MATPKKPTKPADKPRPTAPAAPPMKKAQDRPASGPRKPR